jgi:hypothetical protein
MKQKNKDGKNDFFCKRRKLVAHSFPFFEKKKCAIKIHFTL